MKNIQRYVDQLVEDLEQVAKNPLPPSYFETPPHLEEMPDAAEISLTPYKTIEELTDIKQEVFPEVNDLTGPQCEQVNKVIFNIFKALNIELIDVPDVIPSEWLYEVLTTHWQHPVQYLPSSGMDLEFCTGDSMTCPYGEYCSCGNDWDEKDHNDLPERFNSLIPEIANGIDSGFTCFVNPDTLDYEMEKKDNADNNKYDFPGKNTKRWNWGSYIGISPESLDDKRNTMKFFTMGIEHDLLRNKLFKALDGNKEIIHINFLSIISGSHLFEEWLDYSRKCTETYVRKEIWDGLKELQENPPEIINGLYSDDGEKIDPESVPVPGLCVLCKRHLVDDWEENILCLMNRHDQRDDDDFECGMFEKI